MASILIVDDDAALRAALAEAVQDLGHDVLQAASGEEAVRLSRSTPPEAALIDLRMPGMDGLELLKRLKALPHPPVVSVLTAHATAVNTIEAMRLGAFDHLTKPVGREQIARVLCLMLAAAGAANAAAVVAPERLVGSSEAMRTVQKTIGMLADNDSTVLIMGETGTGKELVARAIHDFGNRRTHAFVAVNCASIPMELLESELFGHIRGAFTGAITDRQGAFAQAQNGTLLLDEIGDMNLEMQAKILRALQERVIVPIGGRPVSINVRIIAATHRDLRERVNESLFREDLFYRLNVVPIRLPALRERISDIVPLAEHFLGQSAAGKTLTPDAAALLIQHSWPGNVRELRNAMERAAVLVRGNQVTSLDLAFLANEQRAAPSIDWPAEDLPSAVARLEEMLIRRALAQCSGNRTEAARVLNVNRQLLYSKIKRYGID